MLFECEDSEPFRLPVDPTIYTVSDFLGGCLVFYLKLLLDLILSSYFPFFIMKVSNTDSSYLPAHKLSSKIDYVPFFLSEIVNLRMNGEGQG